VDAGVRQLRHDQLLMPGFGDQFLRVLRIVRVIAGRSLVACPKAARHNAGFAKLAIDDLVYGVAIECGCDGFDRIRGSSTRSCRPAGFDARTSPIVYVR
jgi:hypothetical protein